MSFAEARQQAKTERKYTAFDGTTFVLRPVTQLELVLKASGNSPSLLPVMTQLQGIQDEQERLERINELLEQRDGPDAVLALSTLDDLMLIEGIISHPILPDKTPESEVDSVSGLWVSDFKRYYAQDVPKILERIRALSMVGVAEVSPARFQEVPGELPSHGESLRPDPVANS